MNRRGPRTKRWGTSLETGKEEDLRFLNKLCATSEIGFRPSQRDVSDSNGDQPVQEDVMSVEGCAEVEENQDGESQMPLRGHL